jgi:hypothetical protein
MPTPAQVIAMVASLQNDTAQTQYTDDACLPYLNIALDELQEIYEENNIPVTNEVSAIITVPLGINTIGFSTIPALPANLIEIQELWESQSGANNFTPMDKLEFLPQYIVGETYSNFMFWSWINNEIRLPTGNQAIDLRLDYIKSIFSTPIAINLVNTDLGIRFKNIKTYLGYETAALCSMYIGENETRALSLHSKAVEALDRTLNIPTKGRQSINTRRRPFRSAYKNTRWG